MLNIFCTNTYHSGAKYINDCLSQVNQSQLDKHHIVIVPDRASLEAERMMLREVGGSFNIAVLTFSRLASMLLPPSQHMSKNTGVIALSAIIEDSKEQLQCFVKGNSSGFCSNMYDTISALKYCKIAPNDIKPHDYPADLAPKMNDIAILYKGYERLLSSGYVDSADKLTQLAKIASSSPYIAESYFYLYDFDNFTKQELEIISQFILCSQGVTVACCVKKSNLYLNDIFNGLMEVCQKTAIKPNVITSSGHVNDYTKQIGEGLFNYNAINPVENNGYLTLFNGTNRVQELYQLACRISNYVRSGGRYRDVFVVTSDINSYSSSIHTIFNQFEIPYFCDTQFCLADHAYTQYIVDFLYMVRNNLRNQDVCSVVKNALSPYQDDAFDFVNYTTSYNISYRLTNFNLGQKKQFYAGAERVRNHLATLVSVVDFKQSDLASSYVEKIHTLITSANLVQAVDELAKTQTEHNLLQYARVSSQVVEKVEQVLASILQVLGDRELTIDQFLVHLINGTSAINVSVLPTVTDCVIFANMSKARKHDIKYLAVLGANYGALPMIKRDAVLLSDSNIETLCNCGLSLEPTILTENKREKFSLYQLLQEATTHLHVSYASSDGNGSLLPSNFVGQLQQLFTDNGKQLKFLPGDNGIYTRRQALSKLLSAKQHIEMGQHVSLPYYTELSNHLASEIKQFNKLIDATNLTIDGGDKLLLNNLSSSVTKITNFYACPYMFYLNYGLGARKELKSQLDASMIGNILHEVLEIYVRNIDLNETDEKVKSKVNEIFDRVMSTDLYQALYNQPMYKSVLLRLQSESVKMCLVVKQQMSQTNFTNYATECEFGEGKTLPPVTVDYGSGKFVLTGKIDRIDVLGNKFIVIDYKSGSSVGYSEKEVYIGEKLQLLVYLKAVMAKQLDPAGFYYFKLHNEFGKVGEEQKYTFTGRTLADKNVVSNLDTTFESIGNSERFKIKLKKDGDFDARSAILTAKQIDDTIAYTTSLIAQAGKLLSSGYIALTPYDEKCKFCDYRDICDYNDVYTHQARKQEGKISAKNLKGVPND